MTKTILIPLVILFAFMIIGCSENSTTSPTDVESGENQFDKAADDASISELIIEEEGEVEDYREEDDLEEPFEEVYPIRFGRQITARTVTKEIIYEDENHATVTVNATLQGIFHILTEDSVHIEKPFTDYAYRTYDMERVGDLADKHRGWHIMAASGTEFWTENNTTEIVQIHVVAGDVDSVITTVSEKIPREQILTLPAETEVTLTVTTLLPDDALFLHKRGHLRRPLDVNGDNTYTITFDTPSQEGIAHLTVDAMSHGTLFDDEEPYDANAWGFVFKVE